MAENSAEVRGQMYIVDGIEMTFEQMVAYREEQEREKAANAAAYDEMLAEDRADREAQAREQATERLATGSLQRANGDRADSDDDAELSVWGPDDFKARSQITSDDIENAVSSATPKIQSINTTQHAQN